MKGFKKSFICIVAITLLISVFPIPAHASVFSSIKSFFSSLFSREVPAPVVTESPALKQRAPSTQDTPPPPHTSPLAPLLEQGEGKTEGRGEVNVVRVEATPQLVKHIVTQGNGLTEAQLSRSLQLLEDRLMGQISSRSGGYTVPPNINLQALTPTTITGGTLSNITSIAVTGDSTFSSALTLAQISAPSDTSNKLYNTSGDLYWAGNLIGGASTGVWNSDGTNVYRTSGNVGIGTSSPFARLSVSGNSDMRQLVVKEHLLQTANLQEWQNSNGVPYVTVGPSTLSGSSQTNNFLNVTGTLPSSQSANTTGVNFTITAPDGAHSQIQQGLLVNLNAGYTGPGKNFSIFAVNTVGGSGNDLRLSTIGSSPAGNTAVYGNSNGTGTGANIGGFFEASGANNAVRIGVAGKAVHGNGGNINIGSAGFAISTGVATQVGGYFGLHSSTPTFESAALIADNGSQTSPIFLARDNGSSVFSIINGGNVGIGTTTPSAKLSLTGSGTGIGRAFAIADSNNAEKLTVLDNGNVGIGTTSPSLRFETSGGDVQFAMTNGATFKIEDSGSNSLQITNTQTGGFIGYNVSATGGHFWSVASNEKMRINPTGNVGIGTTSPSSRLHIASAGADGLAIERTGFTTYSINTNNTFFNVSNVTSGTTPFVIESSAPTGSIYVKGSAGNVGIGTTSPSAKLSITGAGTGAGVAFQLADSNNTPKVSILDNGKIGIGTTSPAARLGMTQANNGVAAFEIFDTSQATNYTALIHRANNNASPSISNALLRLVDHDSNYPFSIENTVGGSLFTVRGNGNVGIGTTTPGTLAANGFTLTGNSRTLEVNSASASGYPSLYLRRSDSRVGLDITPDVQSTGAVFLDSRWDGATTDQAFRFRTRTNSTPVDAMTILGNGNVGIGVTAPADLLSIYKSTGGSGIASIVNDSASSAASAGWEIRNGTAASNSIFGLFTMGTGYTTSGLYVQDSAVLVADGGLSGGMSIATRSSGPIRLYTNSTEAMRIVDGGNVGIGTTSPNSKLHILGTTAIGRFEASGSAEVDILRTGSTGLRFRSAGGSNFSTIGSTADITSMLISHNGSGGSITGGVGFGGVTGIVDVRSQVSIIPSGAGVRGLSIQGAASQTADYFTVSTSAAAYPDTTNIGNILTIKASGNVGIGTTTPNSKLTVVGGVCVTATTCPSAASDGTIIADGVITADAFDIAEVYETTDSSISAGDIVAVDTNSDIGIIKATEGSAIMGIVSTKPGFTLGDTKKGKAVALAGRVPVKFSAENGEVKRGDSLTISSQAGVAKKANTGDPVIGTALENQANNGMVTVFVRSGFQNGLASALTSTSTPQTITDNSGILDTFKAATTVFKQIVADSVTATLGVFKKVRIEEGMEIKDQGTGDIYCVTILHGEWNKVKGECGVLAAPTQVAPPSPAPAAPEVIASSTPTEVTITDVSTTPETEQSETLNIQ